MQENVTRGQCSAVMIEMIEQTRRYFIGRVSKLFCVLTIAIYGLLLSTSATAAIADPVRLTLGHAVVALNCPWRFHTGDDPLWANPDFDDSTWEVVDLSPPRGAHDDDVGLTGYVPGWQARGHLGYSGYAWYRIRLSLNAAPEEALALGGPPDVDNAYQVFFNGALLGGVGNFSRQPPVTYGIHHPEMFRLPQADFSGGTQTAVVALRVWMGPWSVRDPEAGGIHIAPALGTTDGVNARFHLQWVETVRGYVVDVAESVAFVLLAVMSCSLIAFDRRNPAYLWLAAALLLIALRRANQAVFFWGQFETYQGFELATGVLLIPLCLGVWTLAWCIWFALGERAWIQKSVAVLTLLYMGATLLTRSWFYGVLPHWVNVAAHFATVLIRLLFVLLTLFIIVRQTRLPGRERWFALPAVLLMSVGLFADELSALHIPGIWFPFGTGVSRTEYAYAAFDVALFALLLHRLYALRLRQTVDRPAGNPA